MTVWARVKTRKQAGGENHLKLFAGLDAGSALGPRTIPKQ